VDHLQAKSWNMMLNLDDRVDFSDPNTLDLINGWIEDKTRDKIQDMLWNRLCLSSKMYIFNIYDSSIS
jgi:serine protease inhibitor